MVMERYKITCLKLKLVHETGFSKIRNEDNIGGYNYYKTINDRLVITTQQAPYEQCWQKSGQY